MTKSASRSRPNGAARLVLTAFSLLTALYAGPAAAMGGHVEAQLVADRTSIAPGQTIHIALRQQISPGWHTYWRNPGDSGEATTLALTLPANWRAGALNWAAPKKLPIGPLMDYGYEGTVLLPVAVTASPTAPVGNAVTLKARADYLVCKDICVPEGADLVLTLPVTASPGQPDGTWAAPIAAALAATPKPGGLEAVLTPSANLKLSVTGAAVKGGQFPDAYFFPYASNVIDHAKTQTIERGAGGLTLSLAPGSAFTSGKPPADVPGLLALGSTTVEIDARIGAPLLGAAGLGPPTQPLTGTAHVSQVALAFGAALIGGLILNLMPCVFPILSMKAIALARHAHGPSSAAQGLAFMAGVVATFLVLASALIAARAAGEAIGWGFQLQSPPVVAVLALVMLLAALNLSGVFEMGQSLQSLAGQAGGGVGELAGSAITGVLAVAVAAPCTAPFMAGAVGYALTQGPVIALSIFLALGLGLAAPFTALSFAPNLLRLLPRPGAWMAAFKGALAFPMYGAAAWLLWVFSQQAGEIGLAALLSAAVVTAFAAWVYGGAQRARISGRSAWARFVLAAGAMAAAVIVALSPHPQAAAGTATEAATGASLVAEPFSPDRLAILRAAGKPVFVDFTAAWCVTCQVNEKLTLSSPSVAQAFLRARVTYLVGDWTNRDAVIAGVLAQYGRAGVPLYLMYGAGGAEPVILPQILTPSLVKDAVRKAANGGVG